MVIVKVMGGLGNQMFQYALAKRLEYEGRETRLDYSYFSEIPTGDTVRKNFLTEYGSDIAEATEKDMKKIKGEQTFLSKILCRAGIKKRQILVENEQRFYPEVFFKDPVYLIGYWQSPDYFTGVENALRKQFNFLNRVKRREDKELLEKIRAAEHSVSIHVRGGDYLKAENASVFGGICTKEYYGGAIKYIEESIGQCQFFVFTNDVALAEKVLPIEKGQYTIIEEDTAREAYVDLCLMSQCKYNIIANSTFSWWGAWLNEHQPQIVVAPEKWSHVREGKSLYPKSWILCDQEGHISQ